MATTASGDLQALRLLRSWGWDRWRRPKRALALAGMDIGLETIYVRGGQGIVYARRPAC